jgi:hypothetical protein
MIVKAAGKMLNLKLSSLRSQHCGTESSGLGSSSEQSKSGVAKMRKRIAQCCREKGAKNECLIFASSFA